MTDLATALAAYIAAHPSQKVPLTALRAQATTADPDPAGRPGRPATHRRDPRRARQRGRPGPAQRRTHWDHRIAPPLPTWVAKPAQPRTAPAPAPARVWPQPLEAAAALATRPDELHLLDRIASWLRNNPDPIPSPIEERSLEILDDEKALGIEVGKRLFTTGALTLDLLACYPTPLPFPSQHVPGTGPTTLLIAENNATYHSLLTAARTQPPANRPDRHIGWGIGNQFPVSVASIAMLDPTPTAIYYVGDLDLAGLRIAVNAAATAHTRNLPPLLPAARLYRWLLTHGTPRRDPSNTGTLPDLRTLIGWFPDGLRDPVIALLTARQRIPQETLGLRHLTRNPGLLRHLGET